MAAAAHSHHDVGCNCVLSSASAPYSQTLDEMDFERGIWSAAMNGETEKVRKLLNKNKCPNSLDTAGYTALHYACRHGHLNICKLLLRYGADPNILTRASKSSALHRAAHCGYYDIVEVLIEHGARLELADDDGQTALHKASKELHIDIARLLIMYQPQLLSIEDKWKKLPVDYVIEPHEDLRTLLKPCK